MNSVDNQALIDSVSLYFENKFPDDDQTLAQALETAEAILYGDEDNPELSTDGKAVTLDDYQDYTDFMCEGEISAAVVDDEFFDEILTVIDDLLVEGLGLDEAHISLWGECPRLESSTQEIQESDTDISYFAAPTASTQKKTTEPKIKKASPTKIKEAKPSSSDTTTTTTPEIKKSGTTAVPPTKPAPLEVCNELASRITAGGGYVLYVDEGFACEFNYAPNNWSTLVLINEAGLKINPTTNIYSYYINTGPINVADQSIVSLDPTISLPPVIAIQAPTPMPPPALAKPVGLGDAVSDLQRGTLPPSIFTYRGPPVNEETGEIIE